MELGPKKFSFPEREEGSHINYQLAKSELLVKTKQYLEALLVVKSLVEENDINEVQQE